MTRGRRVSMSRRASRAVLRTREDDRVSVRVGINGFGRIGRNYLRVLLDLDAAGAGSDVDLVAVNDMVSHDVSTYLLQYDSTHGQLGHRVESTPTGLRVAGRE